MPRKEEHQSLSDALKDFIKDNRLGGGLDQVRATEAWTRVMGPGVSNYTQKVRLDGSTLVVNLKSAVLREELSLGVSRIIQMMNEDLGGELITKIRLQ
jgi:hypothetical protein